MARTTDGVSWQRGTPIPYLAPQHVSCPSATVCFAVGSDVIERSSDLGASWRSVYSSAGKKLNAISCRSTEVCEAVGSDPRGTAMVAMGTTDGGVQWAEHTVSEPRGALEDVSCPTTTTCEAVGEDGSIGVAYGTNDGGAHWVRQATFPSSGKLTLKGISCPTETTCIAVGGEGGRSYVIRTTDGGANWDPVSVPSVTNLLAVSCASDVTCEAVGVGTDGVTNRTLGTSEGGRVWQTHDLPADVGPVRSIACPDQGICFAVTAH